MSRSSEVRAVDGMSVTVSLPHSTLRLSHWRQRGPGRAREKFSKNILVLSYVYSKQPILGLTQEWFRELSFSRLECGVHKLHISSADWWDLLLPLA